MSAKDKILVCFALKEEAKAFQKVAEDRPEVSVIITGIGRRNARMAVNAGLKRRSPKLLLTCGFAGALNPDFAVGDVVSSTDDADLSKRLLAAGAKPAKFVCASKVATTAAEKQELRRTSGADAVEMESEEIRAICHERQIACATVRAISDVANQDLPLDFNQLSNPDLSLNYTRLALAIVKSPRKIPALMRLQKSCQFAAARLADVLQKVLSHS